MDMKRVRSLRREKEYTQQQIADLLNITQSTYSDYEHGRAAISVDSLIILAKFYQVSLDYLAGLSDKKNPA